VRITRGDASRFSHADAGTDEGEWAPFLASVERLHFADLGELERVVVVAPHPDDESLGAGASIAAWSAAGTAVTVVACTDGEAAGPGGPPVPTDRIAELRAATRCLTTSGPVVVQRLGLADGALDRHEAELERGLAPLLESADLVVSPWPGDGHPDHRAVGEVVRRLTVGSPRLEYPVWAWHWGRPADLAAERWVALPVAPSAGRAKADAVACHASQLGGPDPILTERVVAHFRRDVEVFVVDGPSWPRARTVDRSSPAFFESLYRSTPSRDPWDLDRNPTDLGKVDAIVDAVRGRRWDRGLEVGCGPGVLTERLAPLVDRLLAVDTSPTAVEVARRRCRDRPGVEVRSLHVPEGLRSGDRGFDLVVLADVGYYWSADGLAALVRELRGRATDGATLVAAHWTGTSPDHRLDAGATHRIIDDAPGWQHAAGRVLPAHVLDVWTAS
jgi:LmbE family N-acetylglucosaminyl deacetylase